MQRDIYGDHRICVYFSTGKWIGDWSWRSIRSYIGSSLVRICTISRWCHVSIGSGDVVLDPSMRGDLFWPTLGFLETYPTLGEIYVVRCPFTPQVKHHRPLMGRSWLRALLCTLSRGRIQSRDCVQVVCNHLRVAGLDVPKRITTPRQLRRWLTKRGCDVGFTGNESTRVFGKPRGVPKSNVRC